MQVTWIHSNCVAIVLATLLSGSPLPARAQAGPPFLTNDPGTPGHGNWELNFAFAPTIARDGDAYQVPQFDFNFGLGDRIQLTYEIPYVVAKGDGAPGHGGWGNSVPGIKWRFLDQGDGGWRASLFPQVQTGGSVRAQENGIAAPGPRYLLPIEVSKRFGAVDLDFEYGEYVPVHGPRERILGFVAGRSVTPDLELDVELYDDRAVRALPRQTTLDLGGRFRIRPGVIALFMAGHSIGGAPAGSAEFVGFLGVQILLSNYGRTLNSAEP